MTGRPTNYTEAIADEICERIVAGDSLASICREDNQPSYRAVMTWLTKHESFAQKYARARVDSADSVADEIKDIANRVLNGQVDPQAARVAIDALKWDAGRKKPKVYGDRLELAGDQSAPLTVQVVRLGDVGK